MRFLLVVPVLFSFLLLAAPLAAGSSLEQVASLKEGPGNITVTPDGRIVMSLHQFFSPPLRVAELSGKGELVPFPNELWSGGDGQSRIALDSVLGLQSDTSGVVWLLDNGMRSGVVPKLVGWDSRRDELARVIHLPPPVTPANAFVNDLAVDEKHQAVYIADPAGGANAALIVVDLKSGLARRVLEGHWSVVPEDVDLVIDGTPVQVKGADGSIQRPRVGVNPIALDVSAEWLYYGPMHGTSLYRVATRDLLDPELSPQALATRVLRHGDKPICDGISMDTAGNVYVTDVGSSALGVIDRHGRYRILVADPRLSWPDALSFGPDGYLYTVANQLHRSARLNAGTEVVEPPFGVFRLRPLAPGVTGR